MVKRLLRLLMLAFVCAGISVFTGCTDKDYYDPENDPDYVGKEPSNLDFSTTQRVKFNFNYDAPKGFVSVFDVYTENPLDENGVLRSDVSPIAGGINAAGVSQITRTIPAYVNELYVYSPNLFVPLLSKAKIENGMASFEQVEIPRDKDPYSSFFTRAGNAGTFGERTVATYLKGINDYYDKTENGHFMYDLIQPDLIREIPTEVLTTIGQTFREGKTPDPRFIKDANLVIDIEDNKKAKIYISILYTNCSWRNSLSYFVYTGTKTDLSELTTEEVEELELINVYALANANTNRTIERSGITPGAYTQLLYRNEEGELVEEFPKGAIIGWRLAGNAFNKDTFTETLQSYGGTLFSVSAWNPEKINRKPGAEGYESTQTVYFSVDDKEGNTFNCFGFEDKYNKSDEDFNDLIFHIYSDPVDALVPPPAVEVEDIEYDETIYGTLAFEDFWPAQHDYDMNDVIVKYASTISYIQTIKTSEGVIVDESDITVKKVEDLFTLVHTGADYNNAFSYKVNIDPSKVKSITVDGEAREPIADGSGFIIDICPNVREVLIPMDYNTPHKEYKVVIEFVEKEILQDDFYDLGAPYNPFISPKETPGAEVHLPMYPPTTRVNYDLFGTGDDRSDKNTIWYVSGAKNKYPFAIHLSGEVERFEPEETKKVYVTYPDYSKWVESDMKSNQDWYLHPVK